MTPPSRVFANAGPSVTRNYAPVRHFTVYLEYTGPAALTAIGGATGERYRFDRPGARLAIDPSDRPSLAAVPNLRQV